MSEKIYRATESHDPARDILDLLRAEHLITKRADGSYFCQTHACPSEECTPRLTSDVIWTSSLDDGTYVATVLRTQPYQGLLTLQRGERYLLRRVVSISYDAPFGPDGEDVNEWKRLCIEAADADDS